MSDREKDSDGKPPGAHDDGYGKPPMVRRFKPGVTGNPKGRPKGAKNRKTIVKTVANEMHTVIDDGQRRQRSTLELVLLRLRIKAVQDGNVRAFDELHRLGKTYVPQETSDDGGYVVVPAEMTQDEWIARAEAENKTRKPPPKYDPD